MSFSILSAWSKKPETGAPHLSCPPLAYDPHAVEPVLFLLEDTDSSRYSPEELTYALWHSFAVDTSNARPCGQCSCGILRLDFGLGAPVVEVARFFHERSALPLGSWMNGVADKFTPLASIGYQAGYHPEADTWLDKTLKRYGWNLHALWAVTRDRDWRHIEPDRSPCKKEGCR